MYTINKSAHTKKSLETYLMILVYHQAILFFISFNAVEFINK